MTHETDFSELMGETIVGINGGEGDEVLTFDLGNGRTAQLYHAQDCCETVQIEDINGNLDDLIGTPILLAVETTYEGENPEQVVDPPKYQDSFTWTFYRLGTIKGTVVIRWYGESNGYYSERVSFSMDKDSSS